jgi:GNAT superfamily N-acetyltransferase
LENIEIRIARESEVSEILTLYNMVWKDSDTPISHKVGENIFHRIREKPDDEMWVVKADDRVIGSFTTLVRRKNKKVNECIVENMIVHPKYRRKGVGRRIMEYLFRHCATMGCGRLTVTISEKREASEAFYSALGFEPHGYGFTKRIDAEEK